jgi:hypothetical protein
MARIDWDDSSLQKGLNDLQKQMVKQKQEAVRAVAEDLLMKSQDLVPLDKATLLNSGHAEHHEDESIVAYGGSGATYALYQHEGVRADGTHVVLHYTHAGRGKKYLENPLKQNLDRYNQMFGQIIGQIL